MRFKQFPVFLMMLCLGLLISPTTSQADAEPLPDVTPRIVTLDWTIAETLMGLGVAPQGVAQIGAYHDWVTQPALPDTVMDLGLRSQPNLELLVSMDPDLILISPMFANVAPRLSQIAPVEMLELYSPGSATWPQMLELTRKTASLAGKPEAGERLITETETTMAALRQQLQGQTQPLLIIQFMDARHVRVFGENGLFQAVLDQLELKNAWTGKTNSWGFSLVGLEDLLGVDGQLIVIEPAPLGVEQSLAKSGLWQTLPDVQDDTVITLEPVWSFGALPSAQRFAKLLSAALTVRHD